MFLGSFGVLEFFRSLRKNCGLKVESTKKLKSLEERSSAWYCDQAHLCQSSCKARLNIRLHYGRANEATSTLKRIECAIKRTRLATPKP
jgi:succinate dehydrogenase/fumarate reductase-like Fe-S protein